nr:FAD-dependent oxidoreductase [Halomicronema hongdechloris]
MTPDTDILVIGSGIGGLCCAALLAKYGFRVTVCESHSIPGGAAHGFQRQGFTFDSGPSLYSGLSQRPSSNPLGHVLDAIEGDLDWATYDTWGVYIPGGRVRHQRRVPSSSARYCRPYAVRRRCGSGDGCRR